MTEESLDRELERMVKGSRMPERLRELFAALGDDPVLLKECLARPALADRLARSFLAYDRTIHAAARVEAERLRARLTQGDPASRRDDPRRTVLEVVKAPSPGRPSRATPLPPGVVELEAEDYDRFRAQAPQGIGEIDPVIEDRDSFKIRTLLQEGADRMRLATWMAPKETRDDWWQQVSPELPVSDASSVALSGSELTPAVKEFLNSDTTAAWGSSSLGSPLDTPSPRAKHSATWTGSLMLVWGGRDQTTAVNTGSRYDPATGTWTPMSTVGAPEPRFAHTAVWSGDRMLVWGGDPVTSTGGVYDPASDRWMSTTLSGVPEGRYNHTAVWTGSFMIVWGGANGITDVRLGGRYALGHTIDADDDGFTECQGDCNDLDAAAFPGAPEACDGSDNDCNGIVDDGSAAPSAVSGLVFETAADLNWSLASIELTYDLVRGDVHALVEAGGDFTTSLTDCLGNDLPGPRYTDRSLPVPGQGFYYLVRAEGCRQPGTYDTGAPSQPGSRDGEIAASSAACP